MKALYIFIIFIIIWAIWYFYMNFFYHTDKYYSHCYITNVDDWDTVNLKCNGIELNNIRIAWIDSPDFHPWDKKQCFYNEAKQHLKWKIYINKYTLEIIGNDLWKDQEKWIRKVWKLIDKNSKLSLGIEMVNNWYAFYWINDIFWISEKDKDLLVFNTEFAKDNKKWLWSNCEVINQKENLNIWNNKQAIPPIRTNYIK